ncbi:carboxylating nicotinate-nucleotide diphosphorylase [Candidatus Solincola sp.]|nr:carboxylating nicotinate-nucleotide diphosphorylase [Actinomycetota bacterium]MDI7252033.1 carboxylating nicotinate-nucleotide diphosphorylase [Actinomycetota bacterium]
MEAVRRALDEDLRSEGDITSRALIPPDMRGRGVIVMREEGVVAGLPLASMTFRLLDPRVRFQPLVSDGDRPATPAEIAVVEGKVSTILEGERTALNFLQRLSGVATLTSRFVAATAPYGVEVLDTRKTTPGLRTLEKYAVRAGGGRNHRFGLYDGVLIKDNHITAVGGTAEAVRRAREALGPETSIEVEVQDLEELEEAIRAGADVVMLDNLSVEEVREAVRRAAGRVKLEVSGGINLENVASYASTGVDFISVGALTHSAPALDIALELSM